jgi:XTP/dITP diphosphohydrolase
MLSLILATKNEHKAEELTKLIGKYAEIQTLPEDFPDIDENGSTLEENARIKARTVYNKFKQPTVADDTGLEVSALDGEPGVYTARYAGEAVSYEDNYRKLLKELKDNSDRSASFITSICYIDEQGNEHFFRGEVKGIIAFEPRGGNGFGYDPVFIPVDGDGSTFAEMSASDKNTISHRARAIQQLKTYLKTTYGTENPV